MTNKSFYVLPLLAFISMDSCFASDYFSDEEQNMFSTPVASKDTRQNNKNEQLAILAEQMGDDFFSLTEAEQEVLREATFDVDHERTQPQTKIQKTIDQEEALTAEEIAIFAAMDEVKPEEFAFEDITHTNNGMDIDEDLPEEFMPVEGPEAGQAASLIKAQDEAYVSSMQSDVIRGRLNDVNIELQDVIATLKTFNTSSEDLEMRIDNLQGMINRFGENPKKQAEMEGLQTVLYQIKKVEAKYERLNKEKANLEKTLRDIN